MNKPEEDMLDEEIYELIEQGMTYEDIVSHFLEKGRKISLQAIWKGCMRICIEKGKEEPKAKRKKYKKGITDEEIYELREQGMSYEDIVSHFLEKGRKITAQAICKRCKRIYKEKGKGEPKAKRKKYKNGITDEEIYELREQGMSYRKITDELKKKGEKKSYETIRQICQRIYMEKGKEEPKTKRKEKLKTNNESLEMEEESLAALNEKLDKKLTEKIETEKKLKEIKGDIERER